jgi:hypothetical protein
MTEEMVSKNEVPRTDMEGEPVVTIVNLGPGATPRKSCVQSSSEISQRAGTESAPRRPNTSAKPSPRRPAWADTSDVHDEVEGSQEVHIRVKEVRLQHVR